MLRPWELSQLVRPGESSISMRVTKAVIEEIQRGRLKAGDSLPGTRALAEELGVNRKTVVTAYEELEAQGWVTTDRRRGTFVAATLLSVQPQANGPISGASVSVARARGRALGPPPLWPGGPGVRFDDGVPDERLIPSMDIAQAYASGARSASRLRLLGYGDPRGTEQFRRSVSNMLNLTRGLNTSADSICITRGSQMALFVAAHALVARGDVVLFEELSYPPAVNAFRIAGAEVASVRLTRDGLDLNHLEEICRKKRVRAIYLTPNHHFPTTVVMAPRARIHLRALASQFGFFIVEDDYDHEFHFDHQPLLPLASNDPGGNILYVGSFSKILSPSLRIGYIAASPGLVEEFGNWVGAIDRQGDPITELAIVELIESGHLRRHVKRAHGVFNQRRAQLAHALQTHLGEAAEFVTPSGGLAFWVRFPELTETLDLDRLISRSGLQLLTSTACAVLSKPYPAARVGFASLDSARVGASVSALKSALKGE